MNEMIELTPSIGVSGRSDLLTHKIVDDSRTVEPGQCFIATSSNRQAAKVHIDEARKRGASIIVSSLPPEQIDETGYIQVKSAKQALADISAAFFAHPTRKIGLIGITGTNGKTSVTYLLDAILRKAGLKSAVQGTLGQKSNEGKTSLALTSPTALETNRFAAELVAGGYDYLILEATSIGLLQHRLDGLHFDCCAFTNLTQDHLDYHLTMDEYFRAKSSLFTKMLAESRKPSPFAMINIANSYGRKLKQQLEGTDCLTCSIDNEQRADYSATNCTFTPCSFDLQNPDGHLALNSQLFGKFNAENILVAAAIAFRLGIAKEFVAEGIRSIDHIPGRMEMVTNRIGATIVIDFAHTPDALQNLLGAFSSWSSGLRIIAFGCGGDRDRTKRAIMGDIAVKNADLVIVTNDNPRSEPPRAIIDDILQGCSGFSYCEGFPDYEPSRHKIIVEPDRGLALFEMTARLNQGDLFLVAGKGHEDKMIVGTRHIPFSDRSSLVEAISARPTVKSPVSPKEFER